MPSTISALALIDASEPTLALKVDPLSSSLAIVQARPVAAVSHARARRQGAI